jgi:lipopolysaccharide/colanic/teichoic acid biosynthesis glycosyltransferase
MAETSEPRLRGALIADPAETGFDSTTVARVPELVDPMSFRFLKRTADVLIASVALVVLFPFILLIACVIKLEDGGPVLYRHKRVGLGGRLFDFYKFRSMRVDADSKRVELLHLSDAEGAAFKMRDDPRRTRCGTILRKYSVDEIPQFISVLLGHMSVVGPRPHLPSEVATYDEFQKARLSVKPGLVCLREIAGRSHLSFEEWVRLDLEYVRNRSLSADLRVFLRAIPAVLSGEGAY